MDNLSHHQEDEESRRKLLTHGLEAIAAIPLATFGIRTILNKFRYYGIEAESIKEMTTGIKNASDLQKSAGSTSAYGSNLYNAYHNAYRKSRIVPYTTTDGKGHVRVRFRTEYYWSVPAGLPSPSTVEGLNNPFTKLNNKLEELLTQPIFNWEKGKPAEIKSLTSSTGSQFFLSAGYTLAVLGLVFYEEGLQKTIDFDDKYKMSRRAFFKCVGTLTGGALAYNQHSDLQRSLEEGKTRLETQIRDLTTATNGERSNFQNYFGLAEEDYLRVALEQRDHVIPLKRSEISGQAEEYLTSIENFRETMAPFAQRKNEEFNKLVKFAWATNELKKGASSEYNKANFGGFKELGLIALGTLGIMVPYEIYSALEKKHQ